MLVAQFQFLRNRLIAAHIGALQIIEQAAALADHHQQSPTRTVVFFIALQMLRQMVDALRQQRDLHIGGTGVPFVRLKLIYRLRFGFNSRKILMWQGANVKRIATHKRHACGRLTSHNFVTFIPFQGGFCDKLFILRNLFWLPRFIIKS